MTPDGYRMPAEWEPHERTWMAFPTDNHTFHDNLHASRTAWAAVATTIARHEPVVMVANTGEGDDARGYLGPAVEVVERPLDDSWMRDIGPTFLVDGRGGLAAATWVFNGWGQLEFARWELDSQVGGLVAGMAGATPYASGLVNEGGGVHVDGEGTVLLTETVQLDPYRNPGWTRERVEAELRAFLGVRKAIWLPRGLTADYGPVGTRGHIDMFASFVRPGLVAAHCQPDPAHPDHEVCKENIALLRASTDAAGRRLEVVEVPAPTVLEVDGEPVDYSYINHYVANGAVVLCAFGDPRDAEAAELFARLFPGREVELVDARQIFAGGGGIHCITQQQPAVSAARQ
ncbi:agmatine deiminase family protein [Nonomuraea sp. NPDC046570]|uniref:agmatine deiminase family protein n=1 Tax=Nonomuraea sp. NPDC046570 TaxID=3155255 RepID=UPI0033FEA218